jgi:hypothetical protein
MLTTLICGAASSMDRLSARFGIDISLERPSSCRRRVAAPHAAFHARPRIIELPITANNLSLREGT